MSVNYSAKGILAGITNVIKVTGATAFGGEAVIGSKLSAGVTLLNLINDSAQEIKDSLSTSTVIENVKGSATVSLTSHMRYILVKPYESQDSGNQVTCYIGNTVSYIVTSVSVVDLIVDDELVTYHSVRTEVSDTSYSPYYNDFSVPAGIYYNYRYNGNGIFNEYFTLRSITIDIFNTEEEFDVPQEMPCLVW